jgi:tetratricopeptide (TPR) repeat protein
MSLGEWEEAEKEFRDVLSRREANPHALTQLGATLIAQDRLTEAEQPLNEAIHLDGDTPEGWYQRGLLYLEFGQADSALSDFETAAVRGHPHMNALLRIAAIHHEKEEWEAAEIAWRRVLDAEPDNRIARRRIQEAFDHQTEVKKAAVLAPTTPESESPSVQEEVADIPDFEFGFGDL